jgi:hypothetical protein
MTTGALIFAFNNESTDYLALAEWNARRIRQFLDIPVAVVTDRATDGDFDRVIVASAESGGTRHWEDYDSTATWYNGNRADAYQLSPWDRTLLLDADYVVNSSDLRTLLDSSQQLLAHRWAYDVTGQNDFSGLNSFGRHRMPMWWATVVMFQRSPVARDVFGMMSMIRTHWTHYRDLYGIDNKTYRNDFALSIALMLVNGCTSDVASIPWSLSSVTPQARLDRDQDQFRVTWQDQRGKTRYTVLNNQDFHAMGKSHLERIVATH